MCVWDVFWEGLGSVSVAFGWCLGGDLGVFGERLRVILSVFKPINLVTITTATFSNNNYKLHN